MNQSPRVPLMVHYVVSALSPLAAVSVPLLGPDVLFYVEISSCRLVMISMFPLSSSLLFLLLINAPVPSFFVLLSS